MRCVQLFSFFTIIIICFCDNDDDSTAKQKNAQGEKSILIAYGVGVKKVK